jgi:3-deoxy-manno-octulosonate cytidylyltransferase (CMP-KDO synthetase)
VQNSRILGVIPARLGSERLPGKPLVRIAGRPLIEWVWRRVSAFGILDACLVATDSAEIVAACGEFGGTAVLTSESHRSGTERVAEVAAREAYSSFGMIVNVQGDEPLIEESHVEAAVDQVRLGFDIGTAATPVRELSAWRDPSVVKVTRRHDGAALYFSRSPIPHCRDGEPDTHALGTNDYLRHIGVYAYTADALLRWITLPEIALEHIERLEQLRPLVAGLTIGVGLVDRAVGGVDTQDDVERMTALLPTADTERSRTDQVRT